MNIIYTLSNIATLIVLLALIFCMYYSKKQDAKPKIKEKSGFILGISLIAYLVLMSVVVYGIFRQYYINVIFIPFILAPFLIGHYSKHETAFKYSIIQIICLILSIICLLFVMYI